MKIVRIAQPTDIDAIMRVEHDAFPDGVRESPEVFLERIRVFPEGFLVTSNLDGYICSERWSSIKSTSFTLGHQISKKHVSNGSVLYISSMAVLKRSQGRGIGRGLVRGLLDCQQTSQVVLIVGSIWDAARKIYQSEGFKDIKVIPKFFKPKGEPAFDGFVMSLTNRGEEYERLS